MSYFFIDLIYKTNIIIKKPYKYLDHTRDLLRTPMQWNIKAQAGFSLNDQTYLPVNSNYSYLNVEVF